MRTATCSCGQLSIKCSGEPTLVAQCHCLACQRRTGSTYGIGAFFPRAGVNVSGAEKTFTRQSDSGYPIVFHFCPECGSNVYWEPRRKPEVVAVAAGAFADPTFPGPTKEVFIEPSPSLAAMLSRHAFGSWRRDVCSGQDRSPRLISSTLGRSAGRSADPHVPDSTNAAMEMSGPCQFGPMQRSKVCTRVAALQYVVTVPAGHGAVRS